MSLGSLVASVPPAATTSLYPSMLRAINACSAASALHRPPLLLNSCMHPRASTMHTVAVAVAHAAAADEAVGAVADAAAQLHLPALHQTTMQSTAMKSNHMHHSSHQLMAATMHTQLRQLLGEPQQIRWRERWSAVCSAC